MSRPSRKSAVFSLSPRFRRGFTLVELLVVILILAILMAVALPLYFSAIRNSTRRAARVNMKMLTTANIAFRLQSGQFAPAPGTLVGAGIIQDIPTGPGSTDYTLYSNGESLPDSRTLGAGKIAACGSDVQLGANGNYGCYIAGEDKD